MADKDYFSFDEVLKNLAMEEDELKRLVSAGEIRAFRDQDRMKFKAEDVDRLRETDDAELDLDDDLELDLGDDLEFDGDDLLEGDGDDLLLDGDDDLGDVEEIDLSAEAEAETAKQPRSRSKSAGAPARSTPRSKAGDAAAEPTEGPLVVAGLFVGFVILLLGTMVVLDGVGGNASNGVTRFVANLFAG